MTETGIVEDVWSKLAAPFPAEVVSWRVGSVNKTSKRGLALAYIDARDVMKRLDVIVGPGNWQDRYPHAAGKTVCEIDIWIDGRGWVTKADGAGDSDVEAEKGALSDAFKRAAVRWGIGRYLYDLPSPWVQVEEFGKSYKIAESEVPRLRELLSGNAKAAPKDSPKAMALKGHIRTLMQSIRNCENEDALEELLANDDVKEYREDCKRLLPGWSDGNEGGLEDLIISTRRAFKTGSMKSAIDRGPPPGHPANDEIPDDPFRL